MLPRVACSGAPRDLGLDQGRAYRSEIRALAREFGLPEGGLAARRHGRVPAPQRVGLARDLARYFPHLSERAAGLTAGARVPQDVAWAAIEQAAQPASQPDAPAAGFAAGGGSALVLAVTDGAWLLRTSDADGGYRTLTLTRPAFVGSHAGVNTEGLAGVASALAAPREADRCRAPGLLLLDQCLERFDGVEQALDWCERRPGGGHVRLFFTAADGARGAIEVDGASRTRLDPAQWGADPKAPRVSIDAARHSVVRTDAAGADHPVSLEPHSR